MGKTKQNLVEVFPNFHYPPAPEVVGWSIIPYRWGQLSQILFSRKFEGDLQIYQSTIGRYAHQDVIDFYRAFTRYGLHPDEQNTWNEVKKGLPANPRVLVVGCGTGREVFALEKEGCAASGIDISPQLIQIANEFKKERGSSAQFHLGDLHRVEKGNGFHLILLTHTLLNHVPRKPNRIHLLRKARSLLSENGKMFTTADILPLNQSRRLLAASWLLRLRWLGQNRWERGDTLQANLGPFSASNSLIFYHYFPDAAALENEFHQSGCTARVAGQSWILEKQAHGD